MDLLRELFLDHRWSTLLLIDNCMSYPPEALQEVVVSTDHSILHTLTHVVGTEQGYLVNSTGETVTDPIRRGEILSLTDLRQRCEDLSQSWEEVLGRISQLAVTLRADGVRPETAHGENLLVVQAIQHGIDHRTQICTPLSVLGQEPPENDGWSYWTAAHPASV
jgi:uncharacterized damage-inducible protein DinB